MSLNVLAIGASRNIGYFSSLRFLEAGARVTFLLRSPEAFDNDEVIQRHVEAKEAVLVKGDALSQPDVQRAWDEAAKQGAVDVVLFSVGGTPKFSLSKGFYITPPNLVTQCFLNTVCSIPAEQRTPDSSLRFVVVTSSGLTKPSLASLPFPVRLLYRRFLHQPHVDKIGTERIIAHVAGREWNKEDAAEPGDEIMGQDWTNTPGLPAFGSFQAFLVVRPLLLTDGDCRADKEEYKRGGAKAPYKVSEEGMYSWTVSRKDVGHFISEAILTKWDTYGNKIVNIGY